jgi:tRNA 2-thiouridine synthesizing protein A
MAEEPYEELDLRGLKCPLPVLRLRKKIAALASGEIVRVETTDPLAGIDIPHFCSEDGHSLLKQETLTGGRRFTIRKG